MNRTKMVKRLLLCVFSFVLTQACQKNGREFKNGEQWIERKSFVMQCNKWEFGWQIKVVGCKTPKGATILTGQNLTEEDLDIFCEKMTNGSIQMHYKSSRRAKCGQRSYGEIWLKGQFELLCADYGHQKIMACLTRKGARIEVDTARVEGPFLVSCRRLKNNGTVIVSANLYDPAKSGCFDPKNNIYRVIGSSWVEKKYFNKTCTVNSQTVISNCITDGGRLLHIGEIHLEEGYEYHCERDANGTIWLNVENESSNASAKKCIDIDGNSRSIGEIWVESDQFNKTCDRNGQISLINCIQEGKRVPIGGKISKNRQILICSKRAQIAGTKIVNVFNKEANSIQKIMKKEGKEEKLENLKKLEQSMCARKKPGGVWNFGFLTIKCPEDGPGRIIGCVDEQGKTIMRNGFYSTSTGILYQCEISDDSLMGRVVYNGCFSSKIVPIRPFESELHHLEEDTWFESENQEFQCTRSGVRLVRCHFDAFNEKISLEAGEWRAVGGILHKCGIPWVNQTYSEMSLVSNR